MKDADRLRPGVNNFVRTWLRQARHGPRAIVLAYHRVASLPTDPFDLAVTPSHFQEHLEVLKAMGTPVCFGELREALSGAGRWDTLVCVTFDDGYADNLHLAKPLLERHATPATVFITSGQLESSREFWWDEIGQLIELEGNDQHTPSYDSTGASETTRDFTAGLNPVRALRERLYSMPHRERTDFLDERWRERELPPTVRPTHATLTSSEVAELSRGGLIEIGGHTVSHPHLPFLSPQAQKQEILGCKQALEELVDGPVASFAYPFGATSPYTCEVVKEAGFSSACTVEPGSVARTTDPWMIPRLLVADCDGDALASTLRSHLARAPLVEART